MDNASHCKLTLSLQVVSFESDSGLYRLDVKSKVPESRLEHRFDEKARELHPLGERPGEASEAGIPPLKKPRTEAKVFKCC